MTIILSPGHKETAEVEFSPKHPDIFSSHLAASLVEALAEQSHQLDQLDELRLDLNIQSFSNARIPNQPTPITISIAGQTIIPYGIDFRGTAGNVAISLLEKAGYLSTQDYSKDQVYLNLTGIISQSHLLNGTSQKNLFADSCVVYGHHIAEPSGIDGTFPSLIIAQKIDEALARIPKAELPELRPDGKVHVTTSYTPDGFTIDDIYISASHAGKASPDFRDTIEEHVNFALISYDISKTDVQVNEGGDFSRYFLEADAGVSKAKDDVIITGGLHQLGTDRVWGKCLYKASSTLIPYTFSLSRAICDSLGARYASVSAYSRYGQKEVELELHDIDPAFEKNRAAINEALKSMPDNRDWIREMIGMEIGIASYRAFNDVSGFHSPKKPWKKENPGLIGLFMDAYNP